MTVAVLRPASCFAGVVRDDGGRAWALFVGPSRLRAHVLVIARGAGRMFAGDLDVRAGVFDELVPPSHGQRRKFLDQIADHLVQLARLAAAHGLPQHGAVEILSSALAARGRVA